MTLKTAESVCIGHPDKLCDLICETILSNILLEDPAARIAVEAVAKGRHIYIFGEITAKARLYLKEWTRKALSKASYNPRSFRIHLNITRQSADIDHGVTQSYESRTAQDNTAHALLGAGDQGTVYGYATNETKEYLPAPLVIAHNICRRLDEARTKGLITGIHSDGKAQVTLRYDENNHPLEATAIVVSIQHLSLQETSRTHPRTPIPGHRPSTGRYPTSKGRDNPDQPGRVPSSPEDPKPTAGSAAAN